MADWKQITARIRRARTGKDPAGQLTNLFSKTRDAMVAFELARYLESIGNPGDAGRWYLTAAERFRRADWKTKAQEAATRLGATSPAEIPEPIAKTKETESSEEAQPVADPVEEQSAGEAETQTIASAPESVAERRPQHSGREQQRHRRGRRGQEGHRGQRREHSQSSRDRQASPRNAAPVE